MERKSEEPPARVVTPDGAVPVRNGKARWNHKEFQRTLENLAIPFDPKLVAWRVIATTRGRDGLRGQVAPFADPRAYTDRLNALFTPSGWTRTYSVQTVNNVQRAVSNQSSCVTGKVLVTCTLTIFGLGAHSGTGEEWADSPNAMTSAEAQAFKRACVCFGLGRYLYDLPRCWVAVDEARRIVGQLPALPEWAIPPENRNGNGTRHCATSRKREPRRGGDKAANAGETPRELVTEIRRFEAKVGDGIFRYCVRSLAGVEQPEEVTDAGTLTAILERLKNAARGVEKLLAAIEAVHYETYIGLTQEMKLASDALDDVPDIATLRRLIQRLEEAKAAGNGAPRP